MGGSNYNDAIYRDRIDTAAKTGKSVFTHDADVRTGTTARKVHEKLDPKKVNSFGKIIRESFDSDAHPVSRAVGVVFDTTGSMQRVPQVFVQKLGNLMAMLLKKGYLTDPHVLFAAINDATTGCIAPLQVGQFEAGNEMDESLSLMLMEGGGGGTNNESYELAMYFLARKSHLHCLEKRGLKGYLFFCGDEMPYPTVRKDFVERYIGETLETDIPLERILEELREKFEVFWVMPGDTQHANDPEVIEPMQRMFGQNYFRLENPEDVCELIAQIIGINEGFDVHTMARDLKDVGADHASVGRTSKAMVSYAHTFALAKGATVSGALVASGDDGVTKL
jgi:hypothetical protein